MEKQMTISKYDPRVIRTKREANIITMENDSTNRRSNKRRINPRSDNPRRREIRRKVTRLNRSFNVSVHGFTGRSINVSARGVYLEASINDMGAFPIGASLWLLMHLESTMLENREIKYRISGRGTVVRNCTFQYSNQTDRMGVAFKFTEKLNTEIDND